VVGRGVENCLVFETLVWPIAEGDQEKDGNRPKPVKPKPGKPKTDNPEREGDKGSQRVKRPKREGSASSTLQMSWVSMV
jgi:hypothetical protein